MQDPRVTQFKGLLNQVCDMNIREGNRTYKGIGNR